MIASDVTGEVIGILLKSGVLDKSIVVREVVWNRQRRAVLEPLDEDTAVDSDNAARPDDGVQPARAGPFARRAQEEPGNLNVLNGLEIAEESGPAVVEPIEAAVLEHGHPAERLSVRTLDQKEVSIGVLIVGVLAPVQYFHRLRSEWRHPECAGPIEIENEIDEARSFALPGGVELTDLHDWLRPIEHGEASSWPPFRSGKYA